MKMILIVLLFSFSSIACENKIPLSTAIFAIENNGAGLEKEMECKKLPSEPCVCFEGIEWSDAEIVTEFEADELGIFKEKKKLVNSSIKREKRKADKLVEKELEESNKLAKKALKQSIKDDLKDANNVAKLKALVEKLIELQDE